MSVAPALKPRPDVAQKIHPVVKELDRQGDGVPVHNSSGDLPDLNGVVFVDVGRGRFQAMIDAQDAHIIADNYLCFSKTKTTAVIVTRNKATGKTSCLSRLIMKPNGKEVVDHINGNPLDNRRANLRVVSSQSNNQNRAKRRGVSSRFKGVSKASRGNSWVACIYSNYKQIWLGSFATEESAAAAYDAAARRLFGDFATLNFASAGEQPARRQRSIEFHGNFYV